MYIFNSNINLFVDIFTNVQVFLYKIWFIYISNSLLVEEYPNFENLFTKYLLITILFVSVDAYIQIIFGYNMLGMKNSVA